ncbi:TOMM precursor leader peptide-binding protein [Albimonas pacifica]|uniref:Ribosomal protein S12 methylthiotransferase accessory factor n=1 Tax=Albimonas pacifica TaxID=1114924 RepID=A0A1I3BDT5_9RHOB|nr:TOMM precursor leader peptide-binding protein [Albimonas pacifica]SFH60475.1 ribosomal protein S12 methylthiotransferase accessory factor [Albimonas pacifica]
MAEDLADKHLAIAPHFTVHQEASDRFLLFAEGRSLRLRGDLYSRLIPRLTGERTGARILAEIAADPGAAPDAGEQARRTLVSLYEAGQVVALAPGADVNRQAFWSEGGLPPAETELRLASARVAVAGLGRGAAAGSTGAGALTGMLMGSGFAPGDLRTAELVVALVDDYLDPALQDLARALGSERTWLPMRPGGRRALIGPLMGPGFGGATGGGCLACLLRRMAEHRPNDALAPAGAAGPRPARAWLPASLEMARAAATLEITRMALDEGETLSGALLEIDGATGERRLHRCWTFRDCPVCGPEAPPPPAAAEPFPLGEEASVDSEIGGWRAWSAEQALARLEPLVSDLTGIVSGIVPGHDHGRGLYVFNASQATRGGVDFTRNRRAGKPGAASGKGLTEAQARVSCLAEAVERYGSGWSGAEPRIRARLADLGEAAIRPEALLGFSERQYAERARINAQSSPLHHVPVPFDETAEVEWTPVWSLTHEATRWLPTRFCYHGYEPRGVPGDHPFALGDSNGCAAGATPAEAVLQGLLEVVERDAVAIWWYNRLARPGIALEGIADAFVERMLAVYAERGRQVHLLDLTTDVGIPAAVAVSSTIEGGGRILMGFGAHFDPRVAAERALTELNQIIAFDGPEGAEAEKAEFDGHLARWLETETLDRQPWMRPAAGALRDVRRMPRPEAPSLRGAVLEARDRLAACGIEMLVHDYARGDLPLACVKVVAPGMRHFWSRRGPGRLLEVPAKMGWRDRPAREEELNPIDFVL